MYTRLELNGLRNKGNGLGINGTFPNIVGNVRLTVLEVEVHSDQGRSQFGSKNKLYA